MQLTTESLAWVKATWDDALGVPKDPSRIDLTDPSRESGMTDGAITAMTELPTSMITYQAAAIKKQDEKNEFSLNVWRRLPKIQQQVILLGGVEEGGTVPQERTEEMAAIIGC